MLKTVTRGFECTNALHDSDISVPTAFEDLILSHLVSTASCLIKRTVIRAHILPATGNMNGFSAQTVVRDFTTLAKTDQMGSLEQLMAPDLWLDRGLVEFIGLAHV